MLRALERLPSNLEHLVRLLTACRRGAGGLLGGCDLVLELTQLRTKPVDLFTKFLEVAIRHLGSVALLGKLGGRGVYG
jgi:hypothetical protein